MKKPTLNKWQCTFEHNRPYTYLDMAWRTVRFGIYKFTTMPQEGAMYSKKDYKRLQRIYHQFRLLVSH